MELNTPRRHSISKQCLIEPLLYGVFLAVGAALLAHSFTSRYAESMLFPRVVLVFWIVCAATALMRLRTESVSLKTGKAKRLFFCVGSIIFLAFAFDPLGFLPATLIFFCLYAASLGFTRIKVLLPAAASALLLIWLLFEKFLGTPLPAGLLFS